MFFYCPNIQSDIETEGTGIYESDIPVGGVMFVKTKKIKKPERKLKKLVDIGK